MSCNFSYGYVLEETNVVVFEMDLLLGKAPSGSLFYFCAIVNVGWLGFDLLVAIYVHCKQFFAIFVHPHHLMKDGCFDTLDCSEI